MKVRSYWIRLSPKSNACLYKRQKRTHRDTGKEACGRRGGGHMILPGVTKNYKRQGRTLPELLEGARSADTLIADFWPPACEKNISLFFCLFVLIKCVGICYGIPRKRIQVVSITLLQRRMKIPRDDIVQSCTS